MGFQPRGFGLDMFKLRYTFTPDETWEQACHRQAAAAARAESPEKYQKWFDRFNDMLLNNYFMGGGRIMYAAGRTKPSMMNCFVVPVEDSREGWGRLISDAIIISGSGGGVGTNFSPIRPRGSDIKGTGGKASGAVSLMQIENCAGGEIRGGGSRRAAFLFSLEYNHPDIEEFLDKKLKLDELNNANISVVIDDDFIDAVENDLDINLKFNDKIFKTIKARTIYSIMINNAVKMGEPGILNLGLANRMNNIWYQRPLICTNPCGELPLAAYQSCCLGSIVLPRFVKSTGTFDFQRLADIIPHMVRFLDNILDVNSYPLPIIEKETKLWRRIGIGVMGLHDTLLLMGIKYSSNEAIEFIDKLMNFIKKKVYTASTYLAVEKGPFEGFDKDSYLKGQFVRGLSPSVKTNISQYGIRNSALMTLPPTGTTSIVAGVSSGIEPIFSYAYKRRFRDSDDSLKEEIVVHPLFKKFIDEGRDVSHFESAHEITPEQHIRIQVVCQKHIDGSISKTINLPRDYNAADFEQLVLRYIRELKGLTVYREGSRGEAPLESLTMDEAISHIAADTASLAPPVEQKCRSGVCDI